MKKIILTSLLILVSLFPTAAQRVFMVGDSHVAGKIYPEVVEENLKSEVDGVIFDFWGKNGARFDSFNKNPDYMNRIYQFKPDILVVHLGTNDSYAKEFHKKWFDENISKFYENVENHLPDCKIIFVTPFINKLRAQKDPNESTIVCSEAIREFAARHPNCYVADNNADYGDAFIDDPDLIRQDNVHLTVEGYEELGLQVVSEIFNTGLFD